MSCLRVGKIYVVENCMKCIKYSMSKIPVFFITRADNSYCYNLGTTVMNQFESNKDSNLARYCVYIGYKFNENQISCFRVISLKVRVIRVSFEKNFQNGNII